MKNTSLLSASFLILMSLGLSKSSLASSGQSMMAQPGETSAQANDATELKGRLPLGGVCFCGDYSATNRSACKNYVANLGISSTEHVTLTGKCTEQMNDFSKCNGAYCSLFTGFAILN